MQIERRGVLIDKRLKNGVVDVRRQGEWIILVKLVFVDQQHQTEHH
jgi:hypothetical protein